MNFAVGAISIGAGWTPSFSKRALISGSRRISVTASLSLATMGSACP
jgi:hypothetical protein